MKICWDIHNFVFIASFTHTQAINCSVLSMTAAVYYCRCCCYRHKFSPVSLTQVIEPCSGFSLSQWHWRQIYCRQQQDRWQLIADNKNTCKTIIYRRYSKQPASQQNMKNFLSKFFSHLSPVSLTPVINHYFRTFPRILIKIWDLPYWYTQGLRGNWFMKTTWIQKISRHTPFKSKDHSFAWMAGCIVFQTAVARRLKLTRPRVSATCQPAKAPAVHALVLPL